MGLSATLFRWARVSPLLQGAEIHYTKFKHFFCEAEFGSKIQMMILIFPENTFDAQEVFDPLSSSDEKCRRILHLISTHI